MGVRGSVTTLLVLKPIDVDTDSLDCEGRLVVASGRLVAVLVRLDTPGYDQGSGWFLEAGFGRLQGIRAPIFKSLEEATRWLRSYLKI